MRRLLPPHGLLRCLSTAASPSPPCPQSDSLYRRVVNVANPLLPLAPVLDQWVRDGRSVQKHELQSIVKQMTRFHRFSHALEVSMWMTDRRHFHLSPGDVAYRLELINKVHGLDSAVDYFNNVPKKLRLRQCYGSLLSCYVHARSVDKAEDLFNKMEEMGMMSSYVYNVMMKLYLETGQVGRVHDAFRAMEEKGIEPDIFSLEALLAAYLAEGDVEGSEELLEKADRCKHLVNWHMYAAAAECFMKAGLQDKALLALKKSEKLISVKNGRVAYGFLMSRYAEMGIESEVGRIWDVYKSKVPACISMYMCRITMLLKKNDINGAEEAFKEWGSRCHLHDFRVINLLVGGYCMEGLMEKAEALVNEAIEKGRTPFANTWFKLAGGYFKDGQVSKAVDMTKKALASATAGWKPELSNVLMSLDHFMEQKDVEAAEEMASLLQRLVPLTRDVYHRLLKTYLLAGKPVSDLLDRMKKYGLEPDEETVRILSGECH